MCDCENLEHSIDKLSDRVSGYADTLKMAPTDSWEYSEPVFVGGVTGVYKVRSPFMGDCQFSISSAVSGAAVALILVSPYQHVANIDLTAAGQSYAENSPLNGVVLNLPISTTLPLTPYWYNVEVDSLVFVVITCAVVAGVNLQFRQKRGR